MKKYILVIFTVVTGLILSAVCASIAMAAPTVCIKGPYLGTVPDFVNSSIDSTGDVLTINYSEVVSQGSAYNNSQLDLDCSTGGSNISLTHTSGDDSAAHVYSIATTILQGETCNLDFDGTQNSLENFAGYDLSQIVDGTVDNQSGITSGTCWTIEENNVTTELSNVYNGGVFGESITITDTGDAYSWQTTMRAPGGGSASIECRLDDDTNMSSEYLLSESVTVSGSGTSDYTWVFSPSTELSSGTYYVFCRNTNTNWTNRVNVQRGTNNDDFYSGGSSYVCSSCNWTGLGVDSNDDLDFVFKYGTSCP